MKIKATSKHGGGFPLGMLRTEGVALLAIALLLNGEFGWSWWLCLGLLAAPDLGLFGLLRGKRDKSPYRISMRQPIIRRRHAAGLARPTTQRQTAT